MSAHVRTTLDVKLEDFSEHYLEFSHTPIGSSWECSCRAGSRLEYMARDAAILLGKQHIHDQVLSILIDTMRRAV